MTTQPKQRKHRLGRPPKHGMRGTATYTAWASLRARCNNAKHPLYGTHGGAGIAYSHHFDTFEGFVAAMGTAPPGGRFQRRDLTKDFTPDNCFWSVPEA